MPSNRQAHSIQARSADTSFITGISSGLTNAGAAAVDMLRPKLARSITDTNASNPHLPMEAKYYNEELRGQQRARTKKNNKIKVDIDIESLDYDSEERCVQRNSE